MYLQLLPKRHRYLMKHLCDICNLLFTTCNTLHFNKVHLLRCSETIIAIKNIMKLLKHLAFTTALTVVTLSNTLSAQTAKDSIKAKENQEIIRKMVIEKKNCICFF
jgi:hypothetical protein